MRRTARRAAPPFTKTDSDISTLPLTTRTWSGLVALKKAMLRTLGEFEVAGADPYLLGTWEADSKPCNPTHLGKEFTAFCKMNGFNCAFNNLRHCSACLRFASETFATMMVGKGNARFAHYIRRVADWPGHASPSVTLDVRADVAPVRKRRRLLAPPDAVVQLDLQVVKAAELLPVDELRPQRLARRLVGRVVERASLLGQRPGNAEHLEQLVERGIVEFRASIGLKPISV